MAHNDSFRVSRGAPSDVELGRPALNCQSLLEEAPVS
jgi:hypothetical protein